MLEQFFEKHRLRIGVILMLVYTLFIVLVVLFLK